MRRRPLPAWLRRPREFYAYSKNALRSYDYWTAIYWATPPWLTPAQRRAMRRMYDNRPVDHHVDHEVPLVHPLVCGLNVPWNLQYLPAKANLAKHNRWWPDSPFDNHDLFQLRPDPFQRKLF